MGMLFSLVVIVILSVQSVYAADYSFGSEALTAHNPGYMWISVLIIVLFILSVIIYILSVYIRHIREEHAANRLKDTETDLYNLIYFKNYFENTVCDAFGNFPYVAYIIMDINYVRSYHGSNSYSAILKAVSAILSEHTEANEISARITENSFAFEFVAPDDETAMSRLEEIMTKLNSFESQKSKGNMKDKPIFHCAAYHLLPSDRDCELLIFNLRRNCDKISGDDQQIIFCDAHDMNEVQEEKKLTENIVKALDNNEFKMYLQFVVDNKTKKIVSTEALSRWDNSEKGVIGPNDYIEKMEETGLISRHDFQMFELACRQLEKWKGTEFEDISVSCNFTRITLSEEDFIDKILDIANRYGFDRSKLAIEITEDAMEKDVEVAAGNVMRCKEQGFKVYLDDLGSGYTSLSNLCDYPIDVVKIDRDILLKTEVGKGKELFEGIIALAHSLDIKVICEGVETEMQKSLVNSTDCDFVQGWYYSKPIPVEKSEEFIEQYKSK